MITRSGNLLTRLMARLDAQLCYDEIKELRDHIGVLEIQASRITAERDGARRDALRLQSERDEQRGLINVLKREIRAAHGNATMLRIERDDAWEERDKLKSTLQRASAAAAGTAAPEWTYGQPHSP